MDNTDPRLVLRQRPQINPSNCRLNVVGQAAHDNLGGTAGGQSLRHVDNRLIDGSTGRNDPELLLTVGRGPEGGSGAKLKSLGDRRFTNVDVDRASVGCGVNDPETAVSRFADAERHAAGGGDRSDQWQQLDGPVAGLSECEEIVDLTGFNLNARGG